MNYCKQLNLEKYDVKLLKLLCIENDIPFNEKGSKEDIINDIEDYIELIIKTKQILKD